MSRRPSRRTISHRSTAVLAAALALALSACGSSHAPLKHGYLSTAESDGTYLALGGLTYQVQISRQLNPYDTEDLGYLKGLPAGRAALAAGESWFGIFIRVENADTRRSFLSATPSGFQITDTQGHVYSPTPLNPDTNLYAYQQAVVPPGGAPVGGVLPTPGSPAASGPTGGLLLLYKLPDTSYDNRPLILHIANPRRPSDRDTVELDV